ncbi:hypothetical protein [Paracoccus shanxieyensis]|uniref:Uncharacterized protein n=1 Tax=Paracoccus shanxieyensis TaxID=2675752 RepID=A0A6L6IYS1_9RHOB|nr:hypothetical protein [Paracoccus shanxieyensis]MTH64728.1 hypothetical protein [Paracoccus shanxieyensis]MTH87872.1 hypothetical protein [Paracoccus shanxieyensis]
MSFTVTHNASDRGGVTAVQIDGARLSVFLPRVVEEYAEIGPTLRAHNQAVVGYLNRLADEFRDGLTGAKFTAEKEKTGRMMLPGFVSAVKAVQKEHAAVKLARIEMARLDESKAPSPIVRSDLRRRVFAQDAPNRIASLNNANYELACACYEVGPDYFAVDDRIWEKFEQRWIVLNHVKKSNLVLPRQSTPENLTESGNDDQRAEALAQKAVDKLTHRAETLELAEDYLKQILRAVSVLTGLSAMDVLKEAGLASDD